MNDAAPMPPETPSVDDLLAALPARMHEICDRGAARDPAAPAVVEPDGRTWTYGDLKAAVDAAAAILRGLGVRPGDRVVIVNENCMAAAVLVFAVSAVGAWAAPLNARQTAREVDGIADHAGARRVFFTHTVSDEANAHADRHGAEVVDLPGVYPVRVGPLREAEPEPVHDDTAQQVALLIYTSGTTGAPKGVMLSHQAALYVASSPGSQKPMTADDRVWGVLPIAHIYGMTSTYLRTLYGGSLLYMEPRFSAARLAEAFEERGITVFQGVPQMYARLMEHAEARGRPVAAPDLRFLVVGGARVDPGLKAACEAMLGVRMTIGYGMTEFASTVTRSLPQHVGEDITLGPPLPGIEAKAVDDAGRDLSVGETGEIWLRGPNRMLGYYRNPEATAAVITPEGWYRSGDLGWIDAEGAIHFAERAREVIIRSGFNVYPVEVEQVLAEHPSVTICAVVPRESRGNEEIVAFIERAEGGRVSEAELRAWVEPRLAPYKRPQRYVMLDTLPAAPTGKILKKRLQEMAAALPDAVEAAAATGGNG